MPKKSILYTRGGDSGTSSLYNGDRVQKNHPVFAALGDIDELNSVIGLAAEYDRHEEVGFMDMLRIIQGNLILVGSNVGTPRNDENGDKVNMTKFDVDGSKLKELEGWIDELDAQLEPLTNFILPGGGLTAAHLHQCRSVARRAERSVQPLLTDFCDSEVYKYMNRLSDFFFVAARAACCKTGNQEVYIRKTSEGVRVPAIRGAPGS
eukprot:Clim_evm72s236 gene=Clim_evmTU72s236